MGWINNTVAAVWYGGAWVSNVLKSSAGTPAPHDDFWYGDAGNMSAAGARVTPESVLRIAAVFACVRVLSEAVAGLPCILYRRLPDGGKERATDHPLYNVLRFRPNGTQTAIEFFEMAQGHLCLRGNAFARIVLAPNGYDVAQLVPLHPDRVWVERLANGRARYNYVADDGSAVRYVQEEILHIHGRSSDGLVGLSPIAVARETFGDGIAMQDYGSRFWQNDSRPPGVLEHPSHFQTDEARKNFVAAWQRAQTGANRHKTAVLEDGMTYHDIGVSNEDAQFLETRKYNRSEIASIFGVPAHLINDLEKATFSNVEHLDLGFIKHSLRPWLIRWEQRLLVSLFLDPAKYAIEFLLDALERADLKTRNEAYAKGIQWGYLSPNEARRMENRNPRAGGDVFLQPLNMEPSNGRRDPVAARLAVQVAERVVAKESAALERIRGRVATPSEFAGAANAFFDDHGRFVEQVLGVPSAFAARYAESRRDCVFAAAMDENEGVEGAIARCLDEWKQHGADRLAAQAMEVLTDAD